MFQPPYQRLEDARSRQVMLEEAFENAHMPKQGYYSKIFTFFKFTSYAILANITVIDMYNYEFGSSIKCAL